MTASILRVRRSVGTVVCGAAMLVLTACGSPNDSTAPSGADDPRTVAAREALAADQESALDAAALGEPVSKSIDDVCEHGSYSVPWGPFDSYDWQCERWTSWVVTTEITDAGVLIEAYRTHLLEAGCTPDEAEWDMLASYWNQYGIPGENDHGDPYTVDNLPGASALCPSHGNVFLRFSTPGGLEPALHSYAEPQDEAIEFLAHDGGAIAASGSALVIELSTRDWYHDVPRGGTAPSHDTTTEPLPCMCHSGSDCDCPGG
jgi:hypothetical protein